MATKAYNGPVEINGKKYAVKGAVHKQRLLEWPEASPDSSERTQANRRLIQARKYSTYTGGHVYSDFDGQYDYFHRSTLETRFPELVTLPPLWTACGTDISNINLNSNWHDVVGGVGFDSKSFIAYAYDDSSGSIHYMYAGTYDTANEDWSDTETILSYTDAQNDYDFIPHDLKAHGFNLFCVYSLQCGVGDFRRYIRYRPIGGSWTDCFAMAGVPASKGGGNFPEAMTNVDDTALLCSIAGTLYLACWVSSTGVVTTHYSADNGATWTAAASNTITTAYEPTAFVGYRDEDDVVVPHIGTAEGVYRYDSNGDNPVLLTELSFHGEINSDNCRGMAPWSQTGALYVPKAATPAGQLKEYSIQSGVRYIRDVGLNLGSGMDSSETGDYIVSLQAAGIWLFAMLIESNEASVYAFDGNGWHFEAETGFSPYDWPASANARILTANVLASAPRLMLIHEDATNSTLDCVYLKHYLNNPLLDSNWTFRSYGYMVLPWYAAGVPDSDIVWLRAHVVTEDIEDDVCMQFKYSQGGDTLDFFRTAYPSTAGITAVWLGADNGYFEFDLTGTKAGISSRMIRPYIGFQRDDASASKSPKLRALTIQFLTTPSARHYYTFIIDIKQTCIMSSRTVTEVYSDLDSIESSVTQVTFSMPGISQTYVKAIEPTPGTKFDTRDSVGASNPLEVYEGGEDEVSMTLLELI